MRIIIAVLILFFTSGHCHAWSEGGHHLIAVLAFDLMSPESHKSLMEILSSHPRFAEDFAVPEKIRSGVETQNWLIGRAAYWPDIARKTAFDRPNWHWQLGAALTLGNPANVPPNPGPLPATASIASKELHIAQAIALGRRIFEDDHQKASDRAIALCWIAHLVGDAHQPCHSGSLYTKKLFPEGDRGANFIPTKQRRNLHALWDSLLGTSFSPADVRRRAKDITDDEQLWNEAKASASCGTLDPLTWLDESSEFARSHVYSSEVLEKIEFVERAVEPKLSSIELSESYLKDAGKLARRRAAFAAARLAAILSVGVK